MIQEKRFIKYDKILRKSPLRLCNVDLKYLGYNYCDNMFTFAYSDNNGVIHKIYLLMHEVKILITDIYPECIGDLKTVLNIMSDGE
jgi:phosphatidate phosphatase PAH1